MFTKKGLYNLTESQLRVFIHAMNESVSDEEYCYRILEFIGSEDGSPIFKYIFNIKKKIVIDGVSSDKQMSLSRLFIPFLHFSTNKYILDSLHKTYVNPFIQSVVSNIDWGSLAVVLRTVIDRKSPVDNSIKDTCADLWTPKTLLEVWMPIVSLSLFVINSFPKEAVKVEKILDILCNGYSVISEIDRKQKLDIASPLNSCQMTFSFKDLKNKFSELNEIMSLKLEQFYDAKKLAKRIKEFKKINNTRQDKNNFKVASPEDFPGKSRPNGPRHDNDFADITEIQIIPTEDEILCDIDPYLPQNIAGHAPHIALDGIVAHRDIHFRLLRHDLISQLQKAIFHFTSTEVFTNVNNDKIPNKKIEVSDSRDAFEIYRNVSIGELMADKRDGISFQLEFDNINQLKNRGKSYRINYWGKSKRLQRNTLACLIYMEDDFNEDSTHKIIFGTIAEREEDMLCRDRPVINFK